MLVILLPAKWDAARRTSLRMRDSDDDIDALREAAAMLGGILAIAADAIISVDSEQKIRLFNDGAEAIFGWRRDEIIGQPLSLLIPERFRKAHNDHIQRFASAESAARRMGERQEIFGLRKDGREFPAEASISSMVAAGRRMLTVVLRDISDRKEAEAALARSNAELERRVAERTAELSAEIRRREDTQAQLIHTQRMEAFGQLTGGIAHDFNNLLTVIAGNLELLEMIIADDKARVLLKRAQDASEMGARLTSRLLTFARRRHFDSTELDLNEQIAAMVELLRRALGEHIDLTTRLQPQLWLIRADPSEIENAILNLAINARDAMPRGGSLVIETANVALQDVLNIGDSDVPAGDYVRLAVTDSGTGMPPDVLRRAFEPFFTTKPPGKGTGLGLSTVYGFVRSMGGAAQILSEPERGTSVIMYLPRYLGSGNSRTVFESDSLPRGSGEAILVVEDSADVRAIARQHLVDLGYAVVEAETGAAALDLLDSGSRVDLIFSDVVMPGGVSGLDVARKVEARSPGTKVLLTTGHSEDILREQAGQAVPWRILRKPYSRAELARAVRQALKA